MKRFSTIRRLALLAGLAMILCGCSHSSVGTGNRNVNGKDVRYGLIDNAPAFVLVTDGWVGGGTATVHRMLFYNVARHEGVIKPANAALAPVRYVSNGRTIKIGPQRYALQDGRVFAIETDGDAVKVTQCQATPWQRVEGMLGAVPERFMNEPPAPPVNDNAPVMPPG